MIIDYKYIAVELESNTIQNMNFHSISHLTIIVRKRHWSNESNLKTYRFLFTKKLCHVHTADFDTSIYYFIIFFIIKTIFISMNNFMF